MNKQKGITMVSLVIYVAVMIIVMGIMSSVITTFYNNIDTVQGNIQEIINYNKFNGYFLKEVKKNNNKVESITSNYILFTSGNSFSISGDIIYYNNIKICNEVKSLNFELEQDKEDASGQYSIIKVTVNFENFNKTIRYKLENIY